MRLVKAASAAFAQTDPRSVHKAAREQYQKELLIEALRNTYHEDPRDSKLLDAMIAELLEAEPSEIYLVYMRHMKFDPDLVQRKRYRLALSHVLAATMAKTATFYSRYGGLHHDQDVTRIEHPETGTMRAVTPQEPVDGKPTFSPGREESLFDRKRRKRTTNQEHMKEDPQTPDSAGGRPSTAVDEMNNPSRDSRDFESI